MTREALQELTLAYEGLEDAESFPDRASLDRYRSALRSRSEPQARLLIERLPSDSYVLEIGCGNGRLLVELALRNAISRGLGLDMARSRIKFAEQWATDEHCNTLRFEAADALEYTLPPNGFDAVVAITGVFAYFEPIAPGTALSLARKLNDSLRPDGLLCLELYPHPGHRRLLEAGSGRTKIWTELPSDDPWRFYLSDLSLDESGSVLSHEKTFVHRTSGRIDEGRKERLYLYTEDTVRELLGAGEFREVEVYDGWSSNPYRDGEVMVVTARK